MGTAQFCQGFHVLGGDATGSDEAEVDQWTCCTQKSFNVGEGCLEELISCRRLPDWPQSEDGLL